MLSSFIFSGFTKFTSLLLEMHKNFETKGQENYEEVFAYEAEGHDDWPELYLDRALHDLRDDHYGRNVDRAAARRGDLGYNRGLVRQPQSKILQKTGSNRRGH